MRPGPKAEPPVTAGLFIGWMPFLLPTNGDKALAGLKKVINTKSSNDDGCSLPLFHHEPLQTNSSNISYMFTDGMQTASA